MRTLRICLQTTLVTLLLTGFVYPLAMTAVAQVLFSDAANGTLLKDKTGTVRGSSLIGQAFTSPWYFQGRLSAAGAGYDATASGGSNLGPTSAKLRDRAKADVERLRKDNPDAPGPIPAELVTASASGLDPHISPATASWQIPRVARARTRHPGTVAPPRGGSDGGPDARPAGGADHQRLAAQSCARRAVRRADPG